MAQKFILVINKDDYRKSMITKKLVVELRFGNVALHKDLLESDEICLGGGDYEMIKDNNKENIVLSGQSFDYGVPRWDMIKGITSDYYVTGTLIYKFPNEYQYKDCEDIDVKKLFWLK